MNDMFELMHEINDCINDGNVDDARNLVIKALADIEKNDKEFPASLNHFIRSVIANNWHHDFPQLLEQLAIHDIGVDKFFDLERKASYKLPALLNEINRIQQELYPERKVDISSFIAKVSHAFLPANVFILEEYGLPRMISKKIHDSGFIDLEDTEVSIHEVIDSFNNIGVYAISNCSPQLDRFDKYIIEHFYDGISHANKVAKKLENF